MAESKCDKCEIRAFYAKAFDMHWLGEDDCPYVCEVKKMTKQKILETAFSLIEAAIGDDLYEYAENKSMVLATLAQVYGIIVATRETLEECDDADSRRKDR